jgi:DtxR family Mn-dependent transcriptional regulator
VGEHDRGQRVAEDYVSAIAALEAEGQNVIGARLAKIFGVSPPTVTETLHRLESVGYVRVNANKDVTLTSLGRDLATRTLRRRRVAERFLVDALGLPLADARAEADRLEHAMSDVTVDRLSKALGQPGECPHGARIDEGDRGPSLVAMTLDQAPIGLDLVVERVSSEVDADEPLTTRLTETGLMSGSRLSVVAALGGGLLIRCARGDVVLSTRMAQAIRVRLARPARDAELTPRTEPWYRLEVSSVQGTCVAGYRTGDRFEFGHCAPKGLCLEALQKLYPAISALRLAGPVASPIQVPCPEDGIVTFTLERTSPSAPGEEPST